MDAFYGRTDGQADRILIARPRLHCMQRGKKPWINFHENLRTDRCVPVRRNNPLDCKDNPYPNDICESGDVKRP